MGLFDDIAQTAANVSTGGIYGGVTGNWGPLGHTDVSVEGAANGWSPFAPVSNGPPNVDYSNANQYASDRSNTNSQTFSPATNYFQGILSGRQPTAAQIAGKNAQYRGFAQNAALASSTRGGMGLGTAQKNAMTANAALQGNIAGNTQAAMAQERNAAASGLGTLGYEQGMESLQGQQLAQQQALTPAELAMQQRGMNLAAQQGNQQLGLGFLNAIGSGAGMLAGASDERLKYDVESDVPRGPNKYSARAMSSEDLDAHDRWRMAHGYTPEGVTKQISSPGAYSEGDMNGRSLAQYLQEHINDSTETSPQSQSSEQFYGTPEGIEAKLDAAKEDREDPNSPRKPSSEAAADPWKAAESLGYDAAPSSKEEASAQAHNDESALKPWTPPRSAAEATKSGGYNGPVMNTGNVKVQQVLPNLGPVKLTGDQEIPMAPIEPPAVTSDEDAKESIRKADHNMEVTPGDFEYKPKVAPAPKGAGEPPLSDSPSTPQGGAGGHVKDDAQAIYVRSDKMSKEDIKKDKPGAGSGAGQKRTDDTGDAGGKEQAEAKRGDTKESREKHNSQFVPSKKEDTTGVKPEADYKEDLYGAKNIHAPWYDKYFKEIQKPSEGKEGYRGRVGMDLDIGKDGSEDESAYSLKSDAQAKMEVAKGVPEAQAYAGFLQRSGQAGTGGITNAYHPGVVGPGLGGPMYTMGAQGPAVNMGGPGNGMSFGGFGGIRVPNIQSGMQNAAASVPTGVANNVQIQPDSDINFPTDATSYNPSGVGLPKVRYPNSGGAARTGSRAGMAGNMGYGSTAALGGGLMATPAASSAHPGGANVGAMNGMSGMGMMSDYLAKKEIEAGVPRDQALRGFYERELSRAPRNDEYQDYSVIARGDLDRVVPIENSVSQHPSTDEMKDRLFQSRQEMSAADAMAHLKEGSEDIGGYLDLIRAPKEPYYSSTYSGSPPVDPFAKSDTTVEVPEMRFGGVERHPSQRIYPAPDSSDYGLSANYESKRPEYQWPPSKPGRGDVDLTPQQMAYYHPSFEGYKPKPMPAGAVEVDRVAPITNRLIGSERPGIAAALPSNKARALDVLEKKQNGQL